MAVIIQSGLASFTAFQFQVDIGIANVNDLSKTRIEIQTNHPTGVSTYASAAVTGALTSTTNAQFKRESFGGGEAITVHYDIIYDDDQTVQSGNRVINVNPSDIAVSAVTLGQAYPYSSTRVGAGGSPSLMNSYVQMEMNSSTTIRCWTEVPGNAVIAEWQLISNSNLTVQEMFGSANNAGHDIAVSAFDDTNTIFYLNMDNKGTTVFNQIKVLRHDTSTNIRLVAWATGNSDYTVYVVSDPRTSVQYGYGGLTASTNLLAISSVDTTQSYTHMAASKNQWASVNSGVTDMGTSAIIANLVSPTSVDIRRTSNGGATFVITWFVVEYTDGSPGYPFLKTVGKIVGKSIGKF